MAHRADCSAQGCAFAVESVDEGEIITVIRTHASEQHDMDISEDDARGMMQET